MELLRANLLPWIVSNVVAILILIAAIYKPKIARLLFVLLFAWACGLNYAMAHNNPEAYLEYASLTPFPLYADFINGWFKEHVTLMVSLISIGQGMIALGMLLKGWFVKLAGLGTVIFLLAIVPLGIGSGFPFSLTGCAAICFILKNDDLNYLWRFRR
ncbi:MAG: hypothetical protein GY751_06810 [Bacteroidetes bacterium]|nr:hypothetical protein [Bacteroidota bacterium]